MAAGAPWHRPARSSPSLRSANQWAAPGQGGHLLFSDTVAKMVKCSSRRKTKLGLLADRIAEGRRIFEAQQILLERLRIEKSVNS
jgi:hypothetical protein